MEENKNEMPDKPQISEVDARKDIGDNIIGIAENIVSEEDYSEYFKNEDVRNNKEFAIISYIPLVAFYVLYTKKHKESDYLSFHVNQGIILSISWIVVVIITFILKAIFTIHGLGIVKVPMLISFICFILYSLVIILTIFGLYHSIKGISKKLPIVGKINIIK